MKLLFDQNLSPRLVLKLADLIPDSNHVYAVDLDRAQDHEVYEYARREGFMLVTKDADFGELNVLRGSPPKVVWIRRGNCSTATIEEILRRRYDCGVNRVRSCILFSVIFMIVLINRSSSSQRGFRGAVYYLVSPGEAVESCSMTTQIANVHWNLGQSRLSF